MSRIGSDKLRLEFLAVDLGYLLPLMCAGHELRSVERTRPLLGVPVHVGDGRGHDAGAIALRLPTERFEVEELNPLEELSGGKLVFKVRDGRA